MENSASAWPNNVTGHAEQQKLNAAPLRLAPVKTSEGSHNKSLPGGRHLKSLERDPNKFKVKDTAAQTNQCII